MGTNSPEYMRQWREKNADHAREYARGYYAEHREKITARIKDFLDAHPEQKTAHRAVNYAVRRGYLERQPCEVCGEARADAHHDDYSKPREVRWLCRKHHKALHRERREA